MDAPSAAPDACAVLFRAALLAGHGAAAQGLASRMAAAIRPGGGRACFDAGSPLQFAVDAPGPAALRVGLRLGAAPEAAALHGLVPQEQAACLLRALAELPPPAHEALGQWLWWGGPRASIYADLRDPDPAEARARLDVMLRPAQRLRLRQLEARLGALARPWMLRVQSAPDGSTAALQLHWLLDRHARPADWVEAIVPGGWARALAVLSGLGLRRPAATGRWVVATSLDADEPRVRLGHSGWLLVPEDGAKHRAVGEAMRALQGPRDHAEALWSFCRSAAAERWRVGRSCEVMLGPDAGQTRLRLYLTPQVG